MVSFCPQATGSTALGRVVVPTPGSQTASSNTTGGRRQTRRIEDLLAADLTPSSMRRRRNRSDANGASIWDGDRLSEETG